MRTIIVKSIIILFISLGFVFQACFHKLSTTTKSKDSTALVFPLEKWQRNQKPVLKGFLHAYQPCVVETKDKEYPYMMWFFGWIEDICNPGYTGCDAIYVARSKDLDTWEVYCKDSTWDVHEKNEKWQPVIHGDPDLKLKFFDSYHCGDPSVVLKDGIFYMAYSATSDVFNKTEGYPYSIICCIMGATSQDGIHWRKSEKPLLIAAEDLIFPPKPSPERIGDFHRPSLLWNEKKSKWDMYFDYYHPAIEGFPVSLAENTGDFLRGKFEIVNPLDDPLLTNWPNPDMVCFDSVYYSFSDGRGYSATAPQGKVPSGWQSRQIMIARSRDGLEWEKLYTIPPDSGIDANQIPQALVCKRDGKLWLYVFYATQVGWRDNGIDYKLFNEGEEYNWFYDEIRYMRQEITTEYGFSASSK